MAHNQFINALRPGSKYLNEERDIKDLGRFVLVFKTASFLQSRKYLVMSKKQLKDPVFWTWDRDYLYQLLSV